MTDRAQNLRRASAAADAIAADDDDDEDDVEYLDGGGEARCACTDVAMLGAMVSCRTRRRMHQRKMFFAGRQR